MLSGTLSATPIIIGSNIDTHAVEHDGLTMPMRRVDKTPGMVRSALQCRLPGEPGWRSRSR